jgi:hypothetical protein
MKKLLFSFSAILLIFTASARAEDFKSFDKKVDAEVITEKAFVRADHDNKAKRLHTFEEGDALELLGEWRGSESYPWYKVKTDAGEGWIYGQMIHRLDGKPTEKQDAAQNQDKKSASMPEPGVVSSEGDYVTVIARGQSTDRAKAYEQAWIEAVRLAVGSVISSKSELSNDEFAEHTIAHSRGVVESFDTLREQIDGKRVTVAIQAKVKKEILADAAKTWSEAQTMKASTGGTVKVMMDDTAKESTVEAKQKSGAELLKEVLEGYSIEMFYSAELDPKVYYGNETKKPYLKVREKFNEDFFWKNFLPKLRSALEGVAVKKEKKAYSKVERQANQTLAKSRWLKGQAIYDYPDQNSDWTYGWKSYNFESYPERKLTIIVPDSISSFTVYHMPCKVNLSTFLLNNEYDKRQGFDGASGLPERMKEDVSDPEFYAIFLKYVCRMASSAMFSVTFLDKSGNEIYSQIERREAPRKSDTQDPLPGVYRSFSFDTNGHVAFMGNLIAFAPGFVKTGEFNTAEGYYGSYYQESGGKARIDSVFLDTKDHEATIPVELDADDLQRVDSMKFEVIFEAL